MMILTKRFCDPPNLSPIGFCGAKSGFLRCESMVFVVRKVGICGAKVWFFVGVRVYIAICSQRCCRPSAGVGADLSCPHIREHTRNGEGKCVCGETETRI